MRINFYCFAFLTQFSVSPFQNTQEAVEQGKALESLQRDVKTTFQKEVRLRSRADALRNEINILKSKVLEAEFEALQKNR